MAFNWHGDAITRDTPVDAGYKNTQNVRRFMLEQCGAGFRFDRELMAWINDGAPKSMGQVALRWLQVHQRE